MEGNVWIVMAYRYNSDAGFHIGYPVVTARSASIAHQWADDNPIKNEWHDDRNYYEFISVEYLKKHKEISG